MDISLEYVLQSLSKFYRIRQWNRNLGNNKFFTLSLCLIKFHSVAEIHTDNYFLKSLTFDRPIGAANWKQDFPRSNELCRSSLGRIAKENTVSLLSHSTGRLF